MADPANVSLAFGSFSVSLPENRPYVSKKLFTSPTWPPQFAIVSDVPFRDIAALMASGRRQYPFHLIEPKWQQHWDEQQTFRAWNPGEVLPKGHPFASRHDLEGKTASAEQ